MFYIGVALTLLGVMRLITTILSVVALDRQVQSLGYYGQQVRAREISAASTRNGMSFMWSFAALFVGVILIYVSA